MFSAYPLRALLISLAAVSAAPSSTSASTSQPWPFHGGRGQQPWHYPGPNGNGGYWFDQFESVLEVMQANYWNGTYWPTTIQWIGAFLDTLLAASDRSFTNALIEYGGNVPGANTNSGEITQNIQTYFGEIEAYYGDEDVIQIFGAAYDDAQWVVLEWLEAIKFINQYDAYSSSNLGQNRIADFAHRAHIFYNIVQDKFDTSLCGGGLTWNPALAVYKNAITNELFLSSSVGMYLYFPGDSNADPYPSPQYTEVTNLTLSPLPSLAKHDPILLNNAIREYEWFRSQPFRDAQGLVIDGFHVSDNQTTCDEPSTMVYTYNQGVLLSGLRQLWEATGDVQYLTDAYDYIFSTINATGWYARSFAAAGQWAGLGRNGIMEDYCDATANCSQDAQIFKGIYFHHLDAFCEPLPTTAALMPGLTFTASAQLAASHAQRCAGYLPWVQHNAYAALATRNASQIIGGWWGAPYVNRTQAPAPQYAEPSPGPDPWNDPGILNQPPWACRGWHCGNDPHHHSPFGDAKRLAKRLDGIKARQYVNSDTRTVETQGSGLGVVKAASDMSLKRPAL